MPPTALSPIQSAVVVTILAMLRRGELSRQGLAATVLALAERQQWSGLACNSGTLGFPIWEPGATETTIPQRQAAWEKEVAEAPDDVLAEAWAQLWSRQPPRLLHQHRPPGAAAPLAAPASPPRGSRPACCTSIAPQGWTDQPDEAPTD